MVDGNGNDHNHDRGMWLWDGNAGYRRSDNDRALDTFGNPAGISTVAVEFCTGSGRDRGVLCYCRRECETSVLQLRKILVFKAQHL